MLISHLLNKETQDFVAAHLDDDTATLLFAAHRFPEVDVPFAVEQIEARKRLKTKLPEWYSNLDLLMGGRVPAEQCSSEQTARYKRSIVEGAESLCDMTGGMGVDFFYMSEGMQRAIYTERQEALCGNAKHNAAALGRNNVEVRHGDGRDLPMPDVDVIYLDPARRASDGNRVYAIEDCEPNVIEWQDELLSHAKKVLVKLSPMVDVTDALRKLHNVTEVHVVAVKNECKEVLVLMERGAEEGVAARFHCIDFLSNKTIKHSFSTQENSNPISVSPVAKYLYEPDVTLMKAQAFKSLCNDYNIKQLDYDTRLMTSEELVADFPGRIFTVEDIIPFSSKALKRLKSMAPKANIATRNFPLTADEIRKRASIKDGGDVYLFGATVCGEKQLIFCKKC